MGDVGIEDDMTGVSLSTLYRYAGPSPVPPKTAAAPAKAAPRSRPPPQRPKGTVKSRQAPRRR